MPDYKKMYLALFNAVTTAIDQLQAAQLDAESEYIKNDLSALELLSGIESDKSETKD